MLRRVLINNKGATLVELLIALTVSSIVILGIYSLMLIQLSSALSIRNHINTEISLMRLDLELRKTLQQAMNVTLSTTDLDSFNMTTGEGRIREFSSNEAVLSPPFPRIKTIAVFNREVGADDAQILPTGIFYAEPTQNTSGVLFIDPGGHRNSSGTVTKDSDGVVEPDYGDYFIDNIVAFEVKRIQHVDNRPISVEFNVVLRYFGSQKSPRNFCSMEQIESSICPSMADFYDIKRAFSVTLRNNAYGYTIGNYKSRLHGLIHFYRSILPSF